MNGGHEGPNSWRYTGVSDGDSGEGADPAGSGRGTDRHLPGASERRGGSSGISDSDSGPNADPPGNGRGEAGGDAGRRRGGEDTSQECSAARQRQDEVLADLNRMGTEADHEVVVRDLEAARALEDERSRVLNDPNIEEDIERRRQADEITEQLAEIGRRHGLSDPGHNVVSSLETADYGHQASGPQRQALDREFQDLQARIATIC
jgi:hypothetical protein